MGIVHGLAGIAAVALLVLAAVRDPVAACAYLVVFCAGTMIGMMLIAAAVASPAAMLARRIAWSGHSLRVTTGALSMAFAL